MSYKIGRLTRTKSDGSKQWAYCMFWHEGSGRKRFTLDTQDKPTAEAKARKRWAERSITTDNTVGGVINAYLDSLDGKRDEKRKREAWKAAQGFWANINVDDVDAPMSFAYMAWRKRATNTMRNELSLVRTALHWAKGDKAPKVHVPGIPDSEVSHLTKDQFRKLLDGCASPHVKLFCILGVTTGGRKSAILETKWEQVDFDRRLLNLNPKDREQKGNKRRATVALNDRAMEALREAKEGATTEYVVEFRGDKLGDIKKGIAAAGARAGIKVHPHMFRHTAAVWMAEDRVPMTEIASFLGHKDTTITTRVYARYHPDFLREAARSLDW
jgi:Site-specific recombinase XerD